MIELRPYQKDCLDGLMNWFESNDSGNPLVVLPCGSGKSIINAKIVEEALSYPNQRVMCLTHVRELITQNFTEFKALCPTIDAGIYCAGLKKKELNHAVTFASIQSIRKKHIESGFINLCILDEAHLLSDSETGGYRQYLRGLLSINPKMRIIGLTATEYRLKTGLLYRGEGAMFHDVAYDLKLQRLVQEGWLCRMIGKQAKTQGKTDDLHIHAGEFIIRECESVFDEERLVQAAVKEMIEVGYDRKTWLIFCVSIKHAEHVARVLNENGIECRSVSEKTSKKDREQTISDLKTGKLRAATNVAVLTTGTNIPNIDMIVMLRPTMSPGLLLQMCLDNETEILTSNGWKGIGMIKEGECVPSLDMETGKGKWSRVLSCIQRKSKNEESWVSYDAPRANFRVTSGHDLIIKNNKNQPWKKIPAINAAIYKDSIYMPTAVEIDQCGVPLTDSEIYFIGMFMTDGTMTSHAVSISQTNRHPEILTRIEKCLDQCGFKYGKYVRVKEKIKSSVINGKYCIPRHDHYQYKVCVGQPKLGHKGNGCYRLIPFLNKEIAAPLMSISKSQFLILLQGIHDGDGSKKEKCPNIDYTPRSWTICSARKNFVDRLQALACIHGFTAHCRKEIHGRKNPIFIITITPQSWRSVGGIGNRPKLEVRPPSVEDVWCIKTETGTIITRRKGKVTVMGNCGRGFRLSTETGKKDCLLLDMAGVLLQHGPLTHITAPPQGERITRDKKGKECPKCASVLSQHATECGDCGYVFPPQPRKIKHAEKAHTGEAMSDAPITANDIYEWYDVKSVSYSKHEKIGSPPSLKVTYKCRYNFSEWIAFESKNEFAQGKAMTWWVQRERFFLPGSIDDIIEFISKHGLKTPVRIKVKKDGKFPEIKGYDFERKTNVVAA